RHYDAGSLAVKGELKRQFAAREKLTTAPEVPLAGIVSRLAVQKGIELMFEALPKVLDERPLAFVALGNGEPRYEEFFSALEWELNTALDLYAQPAHWARLLRNGMAQDFSWERQVGEYVALYRRLTAA